LPITGDKELIYKCYINSAVFFFTADHKQRRRIHTKSTWYESKPVKQNLSN